MPQRFRPIAVNNTEVASAGGLVPVKDEEVDGLAALLDVDDPVITGEPQYRILTRDGRASPSLLMILRGVQKHDPQAHVLSAFRGNLTTGAGKRIAQTTIIITYDGEPKECIIFYKYHDSLAD